MTRKNADYWAGYDAEAARNRGAGHLGTLADSVARGLRRDGAVKQRIVSRSPWFYAAMDAQELGEASGAELARRELRELGIDPKDNDPVDILDAHHAGRAYARGDRQTGVSVKESVMEGAARDSSRHFSYRRGL